MIQPRAALWEARACCPLCPACCRTVLSPRRAVVDNCALGIAPRNQPPAECSRSPTVRAPLVLPASQTQVQKRGLPRDQQGRRDCD